MELSESFKNVCGKLRVQVHFKGGNIIKNLLVALKDRDNITQRSGVMYRYKCGQLDHNEEYTGESARTFGKRFKEHLRDHSLIYDHGNMSVHYKNIDNFSIVGRETHKITKSIREAMYIGSMNHSFTGTLANTSCPTYGMSSCSTLLPSPPSQLHLSSCPPHNRPTPPSTTQGAGSYTACNYTNNTGKCGPPPGGAKPPLAPCATLCISICAICGNYNFGK